MPTDTGWISFSQRQQSSKNSKGVHTQCHSNIQASAGQRASAIATAHCPSGEDMEAEGVIPPAVRDRLYSLFAEIEKEFEQLYISNVGLQERVDALTGKQHTCLSIGEEKPSRYRHDDTTDFGSKSKRVPGQRSVSQKIKTTYKASTSRLVSSFRAPSSAHSLVRAYGCHRDGVWEVSTARPSHKVIGTASADHTAKLYSIDTGACLLTYEGHNGSVNAVRFHPVQDLVVTASGDGTAHVWRYQVASGTSLSGDNQKAVSPAEDDLEMSEREDGVDAGDTGEAESEPSVQRAALLELTSHTDTLTAADWMAGGTRIITASWDRSAILHDAESGDVISMLTGHDRELSDVRAHPSQQLVVTASKDTTFRLWDFRDSNLLVNIFLGHTKMVTSAVFASRDKVVSGSDDRTVRVWDMRNIGYPIATMRTDSAVNRISVSPNLNFIAIPHDNRHIRLYDVNGSRVGRLPRSNRQGHSRMVSSVSWTDESAPINLFSSGFDRQVLGWRVNVHSKE